MGLGLVTPKEKAADTVGVGGATSLPCLFTHTCPLKP